MRYHEAMLMVPVMVCLAMIGCASPSAYYCDDGCGPQTLSGRCATDCGATPCAPCEGTDADPFCGYTVTGLLRSMVTCNAGCGEIYWGEWSYDPPDACDPCNNHGDWTGPGCCPPSCWSRIWNGLQGARFCGVRSCDIACEPTCGGVEPNCGCDDCAARGETIYDDQPYEALEEQYELQGEQEQLEPIPAPQPQARSVLRRGAAPITVVIPGRQGREPNRVFAQSASPPALTNGSDAGKACDFANLHGSEIRTLSEGKGAPRTRL